jgi:hypothetical protein
MTRACPVPPLTDPRAVTWKQPSALDMAFEAKRVRMLPQTWNQLQCFDTAYSYPPSFYEGKMWRRHGELWWYDSVPGTNGRKAICLPAVVCNRVRTADGYTCGLHYSSVHVGVLTVAITFCGRHLAHSPIELITDEAVNCIVCMAQ